MRCDSIPQLPPDVDDINDFTRDVTGSNSGNPAADFSAINRLPRLVEVPPWYTLEDDALSHFYRDGIYALAIVGWKILPAFAADLSIRQIAALAFKMEIVR